MSQSFLRVLGPLIFVSGTCLLALMITDLVLMSRISTHIQDITRLWKDQPIVSIYASSSDKGLACSAGYEAVPLDEVTLPSVSQASCGCTQNGYGYSSSVAPCFAQGEHSGYCMSLNALDPSKSFHWRGSTLCVKRAGRPAATYKGHYAGRSHPDKHGKCPNHYKKCGEGRNQDEGAICFPVDAECPITNIMILPVSDSPPADEGWEPAGFFLHDQSALFVRREHIGELPIMNLTVALAEVEDDLNVRGKCYQGESQHVQEDIQASERVPWTYHAALPPVCETSDPRYKLADQVSLADGYLRSLQASESACAGFQPYSLDDPRYNRSSDPDYLNSGVKCGSDPRYVCVRDSNQRTDCVPGDSICDIVVNQNICGAYAHAVRSAFHKSSASLGLYYVREIEWSDQCDVSKRDIFNYRKTPFDFMQRVGWGVGLFFFFSCILFHAPLIIQEGETAESTQASHVAVYVWFVLSPMFVSLIAAVVEMCKMYRIYEAMGSGQCTDDFTADIIMSRLTPIFQVYCVTIVLIIVLGVASVLIAIAIGTCTKEIVVDPTAVAVPAPAVARTASVELVAPAAASAPAPAPASASASTVPAARTVGSTASAGKSARASARASASARRTASAPAADVVREWQGSNYNLVPTEEV